MGRSVASFPKEYVAMIDEEAEEHGQSRNKYVRHRLDAGRLLLDTGKLDTELLNQLMKTDGSERLNDDLETLDTNLSSQLLNSLPVDEDRGATIDTLRKEIFGTPDDQREVIKETLKQLNKQGEVRPAFDSGYIRNEQ